MNDYSDLKYVNSKMTKRGHEYLELKNKSELSTFEALSKEFKVSASIAKWTARYASC